MGEKDIIKMNLDELKSYHNNLKYLKETVKGSDILDDVERLLVIVASMTIYKEQQ